MYLLQRTLTEEVQINGYGTHTGQAVTVRFCPAPPNTGIVFIRVLPGGQQIYFPASITEIGETNLSTCLGKKDLYVGTIEHALAALAAYSIDNVYVKLDANEMPILGGGSIDFLLAFKQVGSVEQDCLRRYLRVLKPLEIEYKGGYAGFKPYDGTKFEVTIDFETPLIGRQIFEADFSEEMFEVELSRARTFGFFKDAERLWKQGYAKGTSLENAIIINEDGRLMNPDGLIFPDEFVRHKTLDAIGDTVLLSYPFLGIFYSFKGGHLLNSMAVSALLSDTSAYEICTLEQNTDTGTMLMGAV